MAPVTRKETISLPLAMNGSKRLHGSIAENVGVAILTGRYKAGDVLPGEIAFSEQLAVSRSAYREAVRTLAAKGMVESRPKVGTRVTEEIRWNVLDPEVLGWAFRSEPSERFIRNLFELRMIVEPVAAALAAERRTSEQVSVMGHALEEMARHGLNTPEGRAADQRFHTVILEATDNGALVALASSIAAAVSWTTIYKQRKRKLPRDPLPDHRTVYMAIVKGDPELARLVTTELIRLAHEDTNLSR
jgi:DNA-binding FadR family transcriptional regulator